MTRVKRTKNIFNENISNESLLHSEQQGLYKISGQEIKSGWLKDAPLDQYITNIYSSLKLAELRQQLQQLKDEASISIKQHGGQLSSPTKANLFKLAVLKKKIMNFEIDNSGDLGKISKLLGSNNSLKISQAPPTQTMLIQKLSTNSISLFQKPITRKCFLVQKILVVESKKNEQKKEDWIKIDLQKYYLQVDYKIPKDQAQNKNGSTDLIQTKKSINIIPPEGFEAFEWIEGYATRILMRKKNDRSYCLYLDDQDVEKLFKYLKFYNFEQTLEKNKAKVFNELNTQLFQKIITLFGNKLRMYDHNLKLKSTQRGAGLDSPMKKLIYSDELIQPNVSLTKKSPKFTQIIQNQNYMPTPTKKVSPTKKIDPVNDNMSQILFSPQRRTSMSQLGKMSTFKLRTKKATVFYDQLQGEVNITRIEQTKSSKIFNSPALSYIKDSGSSPQFMIGDIHLNLKEEGMSEIDEQSSERSVINSRKRTTNISVSANLFKMNDRNWEDDQNMNKFSINIHEIQSQSDQNESKNQDSSFYYGQYNSGIVDKNKMIFNMGNDIHRLDRSSTSSMSSLLLQQIGQTNTFERHFSEPHQISPRSFNTSSSGSKKAPRMGLCLRQRELSMRAAFYGVQMLYPYYKARMRFNILQVDPEIQMQKYKVVCSQAEFNPIENPKSEPRYTHYQQSKENALFNLNKDSNSFIFILKEQSKQDFYFAFEIDLRQIRYQQDKSQLILIRENDLIQMSSSKSPRNITSPRSFDRKSFKPVSKPSPSNENKNTYKFAALVKIYISPQQIEFWPELSTVEFLKKYIVLTIHDKHYDFKYNFVNKKKSYHELKDKVNKKCIRNMLKSGFQDNFKEVVFRGLPGEVKIVLQTKLAKQDKITRAKIWEMINFSINLGEGQLKLLEESIIPPGLKNLKMLVKPTEMVKTLLNLQHYNQNIKERIYEISLFFLHRDPFTNIVQNLMTAFCKEVLIKLQTVLLRIESDEQVKAVLKIYLQVQYQIDDLFDEVRKYFV